MMQTLNVLLIKKLILKDWYLTRKIIAGYVGLGIFALSIIGLGEWQFNIGAELLIGVLIGLGNHQIGVTIIQERKDQTLPFIMSLPISPKDYVIAKMCANMAIFLVPWFAITIGVIAVFIATPISDGLVPYAVIICVLMLVNYCVIWSFGMAITSLGGLIFVMVVVSCFVNPIMFFIAKLPGIANYIAGPVVVWNATSIGILVLEISMVALALMASFYIHSRKKVFL